MSAFEPIIARLLTLHPRRIDLSLDRMWRILDRLGHPERKIPPVIHVAGTNGKGSTVAFMRAVLEAAGRSVHVYTSPHLVRFNERFRIGARNPEGSGGGRLVSDEALAAVLEECERANGAEPITVFEIETAAAFLLFSRSPADVTLLEVGLGGRLDATNVIETPLACAITPVSMDHLEFLGDTIEKMEATYDDYERFRLHDQAFHAIVMDASGNEVGRTIVRSIHRHGDARPLLARSTSRKLLMRTVNDHRAVYDALAARDGERAADLIAAHIASAWTQRKDERMRP